MCVFVCHIPTDPASVQLIIQFLEQASKPSVNEQNQVQPPADNRRNRTLKLLALKVAAHMKWDLDALEKGLVFSVSAFHAVYLLKLVHAVLKSVQQV